MLAEKFAFILFTKIILSTFSYFFIRPSIFSSVRSLLLIHLWRKNIDWTTYRHLEEIECLLTWPTCLVYSISYVSNKFGAQSEASVLILPCTKHHGLSSSRPVNYSHWADYFFFNKKWANPGLFFIYFQPFHTNNTILQQIYVKKCPSSIRYQDSNPRPSEL